MKKTHMATWVRRPGRGFTLIELLVVVAIIALLIGILIPSLGRARDQAKVVRTKATMKGIDHCMELFVTENPRELKGNSYPSSGVTDDPTAAGGVTDHKSWIYGSQWLVRYLMGKDLKGYIPPSLVPKAQWGTTAGQEQIDWYTEGDPNDPNSSASLPRSGPYLTTDTARVKAPRDLEGASTEGGAADPNAPEYSNLVIVDLYDMPILYYAANSRQSARAAANIVTEYPAGWPGIYNFSDNLNFTSGCHETWCRVKTWDFGGGSVDYTTMWPWGTNLPNWKLDIVTKPKSFAYYIMDKGVYESTDQGQGGTVVPYRKDSFLLISPGKDGLFGTRDDITNFGG